MQFWTLYRLFRRWMWVILTLSVCVAIAVVVATALQPQTYTARAVVYPTQEASQEQAQAGTQLQQVRPVDRKVFINSLVGLLRSRRVWEIAQEQGMAAEYEAFQRSLGVAASETSDLIEVTWKDASPEAAVASVNAAVEAFRRRYEEFQSEDAVRTREVLEAQLVSAESELTRAADDLRDYQTKSLLLDDKDVAALKADYDRLVTQRRDLDASLSNARSRASALSGELARVPATAISGQTTRPNPELETLRQSRASADAQMAQLRSKYNPSHPRVIELQASIDTLAAQIAHAEQEEPGAHQTAPDPVHQTLRSDLATSRAQTKALEAQVSAVDAQVAEMESRIRGLPQQNFDLSELTRKRSLAEATYQRLAQARDEARVNEESAKQKVRIRIVETASEAVAAPRQIALKSGLALVATLFLSVVFIMLLEQADNRIKGPADVERLISVRPLVAVPLLSAEEFKDHMLPEEAELEHVKVRAFNETFRSLRSQLFMLPSDPPRRVIGVVSARSGEGRTTVAANLAESIAQAGEAVVLVDANMRQPAAHAMYGLDNERGLCGVLAGTTTLESALRPTEVAGMSLLPAGPAPEDPSVLLRQDALKRLAASLRERFAWVIVDTAPGLAYVDAILTACALDGVVLVVAAGEVVRGAEQRLMTDLESAGARVIGAVTNKVLPQHADALYHFQRASTAGEAPRPTEDDADDADDATRQP